MKSIFPFLFFSIILSLATKALSFDSYNNGQVFDSLRNLYLVHTGSRLLYEKQWQLQANATGDKELSTFVSIMHFYGNEEKKPINADSLLAVIVKEGKDHPNLLAIAYLMFANKHLNYYQNYEQAFTLYLELEKLLEKYGPRVITGYASDYAEITSAYYKFRNYKKSIELQKKGLPYTNKPWDFYNTIGVCFIELGSPDSAIFYLQKALVVSEQKKLPDICRTITLGNIGYSYYLQKKYQQAKPLIQIDLKGALRVGDKGLASGAALPLADIYLSENKGDSANALLMLAREYIAETNYSLKFEKYYLIKSRYEQHAGHPSLALTYLDSAMRDVKRNDSVFNNLLLMRVQQRADIKALNEEKQKLDHFKQLSRIRTGALIAIFALAFIVLFTIRYYQSIREKDKKNWAELQRIMELRQRLSADMHDDIGSTLSSISLYTQSLLMQPQTEIQKNILEKIKVNTQNVQENISDIIWSVNPDMDAMEQVLARMRSFGADMAENAHILFSFVAPNEIAQLQPDMAVRKNLYLIYKEAVNNAIKYSSCKQLSITFSCKMNNIIMIVEDDGIGFDTYGKLSGNGLVNMQRRAEEVGATLNIVSHPQSGTNITLTIPVFS